ncbi:non-ribosomal peptide synthetase [Hassallia byssoidea VB512170]|uniref:Non-ribosomal peptide synthetase n=1 Tax=Hassallia byssoidea VB512170 TaxID=1304833 RepID=A0A846HDD8_9CYAN|nr:non-ribosomal peptide synthetase [Hassalia byssoidea]NEU75587.1 non-ribosomal peptide synthetase [Hassalia byssoidea VB512170]
MLDEVIEGYKLSPQQKRLWSLQQNSRAYQSRLAILIQGTLNIELLKESLQKLIKRHEILRTTFYKLPEIQHPIQVISCTNNISWQEIDLTSWINEKQEGRIEEIFEEEEQHCFDFEKGLLLRCTLLNLSTQKHILLIALPSLCADAQTLENLVKEISCLYATYPADLEEPIQYIQFSELQNELIESANTELERGYWRNKNIYELLNVKLPLINQTFKKAEFLPKFITLTVDPELLTNIEIIIQKYNTSISVFLLACWQVLLWRLTGQSDLIVGFYCHGRIYEELEEVIGLLAKYLPVHSHLEDNYKFSQLLWQVNESISEVEEWQEYFSWDQAVVETKKLEEPSFFPFGFDCQKQPIKYSADEVSFEIYQQYNCIERFQVKLSCIVQKNSIITKFYYDSNLFAQQHINYLVRQFHTLLESIASDPETSIGKLEILSDIERQQLLFKFNDRGTDYPLNKCIHQLIEEQAERTPDNLAVVFENQQLTYQELNARANQLAHHLQTLGVKPEVLVGICVERSLDMLVGILGILKAGGAYVPIDPTSPLDRLAYMLEDSQVPVLLTQERLLKNLPAHGAQVLCIDASWDTIAKESDDNFVSGVITDNLAYAIYTSGSTGKPKGVQITHQNLVHSINARIFYYHKPVTSFLLTSPFPFDSSVAGIFWTFSQGGVISLPAENFQLDFIKIIEAIAQQQISHLLCLPSLYKLILEQAQPQQLISLQTVILAGESCPQKLVDQHRELLPYTLLFNEYGPTEGTVWSSVYDCRKHDLKTVVPIGRPISNTQIYILDAHLQPVPIGVSGELHIGGLGLARGYLNRPELTAEKFIPNPFIDFGLPILDFRLEDSCDNSDNPKSCCLYKTGDLARYLLDGNIEFLGRIDHQVKIRGFRIELGEIEALLTQHPNLREVVVLAEEDNMANKRLIAYLVPKQEPAPKISELRSFLKNHLPDYMIPSDFVVLKTLPLNPNGKVDRQALPTYKQEKSELEVVFVAPRTSVEKALAQIWCQVLGLERVGIHDNFFELGGDSILNIQIVSRASQAGLQLIPKQLFDYPTIAELAALVGTTQSIEAEQGVVSGSIPLTPIQHWFFELHLPNPHHYNQAILLEVQQVINLALLEEVIQQLLLHHDALRLRFIEKESGWQQINTEPSKLVPFTSLDLSMLPVTEQQSAIEATAAELQTSLNLLEGPLMRVAFFKLRVSEPSRLLIIIHHLAVDGVSWRILLDDLEKAYKQLSQGAIQLSLKTTSFKQWAERLTEYAQSTELQQELNYWLTKLPKQVSRLPIDYVEGKNTLASTRTISVKLNAQETRSLLQEIPTVYRTEINEVLLTALMQAFAQWTGVRSLLVDVEGHGREGIFADIDLSRTVGWFTTVFPVWLAPKDSSNLEVLKLVKEQLHTIPNRGIGYGVLRYLSRNVEVTQQLVALPQAEVSFNYLGQLDLILPEASLFKQAQESTEPARSPQGIRKYLLEVNSFVVGGQLQIEWTYSEAIHQQFTIEKLAQSCLEVLRSLITHSQSPHDTSYTPSDFAEFQWNQWSQADLDEMTKAIGEGS